MPIKIWKIFLKKAYATTWRSSLSKLPVTAKALCFMPLHPGAPSSRENRGTPPWPACLTNCPSQWVFREAIPSWNHWVCYRQDSTHRGGGFPVTDSSPGTIFPNNFGFWMRLWWGPIGKPYAQLHGTSPVEEPRHSRSQSSSAHNRIRRPVPFQSVPVRTSRTTWHVTDSGVSTMICNLAKFRPNITQLGNGPPSSLPWSGFSRISQSVILVHMQIIRMGSPKLVSQSSSLEQCNTFVFPVCTFLTTYAGPPSTTQVCMVCRSLPHQVLQLPPLTAKSVQLHQYMASGSQLYGPDLTVIQTLLP